MYHRLQERARVAGFRAELWQGLTLPVVSREISPYTHLVYTSQQVMEAARPPQAPEMAAVAVHLLQDRQQAMGTTAEPMSTPMSRYTYLQDHTPTQPALRHSQSHISIQQGEAFISSRP